MAEEVSVIVRLQELQKFVQDTRTAARAEEGIGTAAQRASTLSVGALKRIPGAVGLVTRAARTGAVGISTAGRGFVSFFTGIGRAATRAAGTVRTRLASIRSSLARPIRTGGITGGLGSLLAGGAIAYLSMGGMKSAIDETSQLGVQSAATAKIMGTSTQTMAEYFALAQAHGVNIRTLSMSFRAMATQINGFTQGNKASASLFKQMGLTMGEVKAQGGDMNKVMTTVLDHLNAMPGGAAKTYVATRLLGRGWQTLMPLLGLGSKHLAQQRKLARDLGVQMGGNPVKAAMKLHDAQVKLRLIGIALQIFIATKLAPAFIWLVQKAVAAWQVIRQKLGPIFDWFGKVIHKVEGYMKRHPKLWGMIKQALLYAIPAVVGFRVAMGLLNIVMGGNPIVRLVFLIAALVGALIYAYNHYKGFRKVVQTVWADVKKYSVIAWNVIKAVWKWIAGAIDWAWKNVIHPTYKALRSFTINVIIPTFKWLAGAAKTAWGIISTAAGVAWAIIHPILSIMGAVITRILIPAFKIFWSVVKIAWSVFSTSATIAWGIVKPIFDTIKRVLEKVIIPAFNLFKGVIKDVFNFVADKVSWVYNNVIKPVMNAIKWLLDKIQKVLNLIPDIISKGGDLLNKLNPFGGDFLGIASGGVVQRSTVALVGERGPELAFLPGGTNVIPAHETRSILGRVSPTPALAQLNPSFAPNLVTIVQIDRREVARATGKFVDDRLARR